MGLAKVIIPKKEQQGLVAVPKLDSHYRVAWMGRLVRKSQDFDSRLRLLVAIILSCTVVGGILVIGYHYEKNRLLQEQALAEKQLTFVQKLPENIAALLRGDPQERRKGNTPFQKVIVPERQVAQTLNEGPTKESLVHSDRSAILYTFGTQEVCFCSNKIIISNGKVVDIDTLVPQLFNPLTDDDKLATRVTDPLAQWTFTDLNSVDLTQTQRGMLPPKDIRALFPTCPNPTWLPYRTKEGHIFVIDPTSKEIASFTRHQDGTFISAVA
ncbi:MAG: hypothetical protein KDK65_02440 [Chlamydiia bacterium]|nr:hypothetical protein [Chlamydiia bacterium]